MSALDPARSTAGHPAGPSPGAGDAPPGRGSPVDERRSAPDAGPAVVGTPLDRSQQHPVVGAALGAIGWGGTVRSLSPRSMRAALLRYRVMAYVVGTGLAVLCFVGIPLQYAAGNATVVAVVGPIHGFAYIAYLAVGYDMARRVRWPLSRLIPVVLAGFVPGLAFVIERWTTPRIQADIAQVEEAQALLGAAER